MEEEESCEGGPEVFNPEIVMVKSWTEKVNISQLCRICANNSDCLISIFEGEGVEHELSFKINKHLHLKVSQEDRLPKNVCYPCASTLIAWHDMSISCIEADKKLHSLIDDSSTSAVSDDEFCEDNQSVDLSDYKDEADLEDKVVPTAEETESLTIVDVSTIKKGTLSSPKSSVIKSKSITELSAVAKDEVDAAHEADGNLSDGVTETKSNEASTSVDKDEEINKPSAENAEENQFSVKKCRDAQESLANDSLKLNKIVNYETNCKVLSNYYADQKKQTKTVSQQRLYREGCAIKFNNLTIAKFLEKECIDKTGKNNQSNNSSLSRSSNNYDCDFCGKVFTTLSLYDNHMLNHKKTVKTKLKSVKIGDCGNSKSENSDLIERLEPLDVRSLYNCNDCGKTFKFRQNFCVHLRRHTGEKPFICHICGKQFSRHTGLSDHLKYVHLKIKNYSCDLCNRSFAMKSSMEDHRRIHTGERPYVCETCGKTFKTKACLFTHRKIHSDKFPFVCKVCNRQFRWRCQLEGHLTVHSGEKNHICDECGKKFGIKNQLTRHKLTHNNVKPYSCLICSTTFGQKRYLKNHMKAKHKR